MVIAGERGLVITVKEGGTNSMRSSKREGDGDVHNSREERPSDVDNNRRRER